MIGTYDPEQNLVFFGTGNPGPDYYSPAREGDNLYTCSAVALDADTGQLKWHFQFTPHDVHDWDSTQVPVLADLTIDGQPRKTMLFANRNGFFYVLDRTNGRMISREAVRHAELGERDHARRTANPRARHQAERGRQRQGVPGSGRRHELLFALLRSDISACSL